MCMTNENQEVGGFIMMMRIIKFKRILLVFCNNTNFLPPTSYLSQTSYLCSFKVLLYTNGLNNYQTHLERPLRLRAAAGESSVIQICGKITCR